MKNSINSILIGETDNVATAIVELVRGDIGRYRVHGEIAGIAITEAIPQYHKFAVCDIKQAEYVRKYGEIIGQASRDIAKGAHVHVHNLASPGRLGL